MPKSAAQAAKVGAPVEPAAVIATPLAIAQREIAGKTQDEILLLHQTGQLASAPADLWGAFMLRLIARSERKAARSAE